MRAVLTMHIATGALALVAGFIALFASKGARLHRNSGLIFVGAMVVMGLTGAMVGALMRENGNVLGGMFAAYLVVTGLTTVRVFPGSRWVELAAMFVALAFGLIGVTAGLDVLARGEFAENGVPAPMLLFMGTVALLAAVSDVRVIRFGSLSGRARLTRHLWRMSFALWVAAGSFFLGQADEFPEALRIWPLLSIPVALPLLAILSWRWKLRGKRFRRISAKPILLPERT